MPAPLGTKSEVALGVVETPLAGNTSLLALPDLIEMMSLSGQQGVVELEFGKQGFVVVNKNKLEHAVFFSNGAAKSGLQALAQLINLENTDFRVMDYVAPTRSSINLPTSSAITEAARLADESGRFETVLAELQRLCPAVSAAAVGYASATTPAQGSGDAEILFTLAKNLLLSNRATLGEKLKEISLDTDQDSFVVVAFGSSALLVARAPVGSKTHLYLAVQEALTVRSRR